METKILDNLSLPYGSEAVDLIHGVRSDIESEDSLAFLPSTSGKPSPVV